MTDCMPYLFLKSKKIPFFFVLSSLNRIFAIKYHRTVVNDACHKAKIPECRVAARTFGTINYSINVVGNIWEPRKFT